MDNEYYGYLAKAKFRCNDYRFNIKQIPKKYLTQEFLMFYAQAFSSPYSIPKNLISTRELCDVLVSKYDENLEIDHIPIEFRTPDDMFRYCQINHKVLEILSQDEIKVDKRLINLIINDAPEYFRKLPKQYITDNVMYRAVERNGNLIKYVPEEIIDEKLIYHSPSVTYIPNKFLTSTFIEWFIENRNRDSVLIDDMEDEEVEHDENYIYIHERWGDDDSYFYENHIETCIYIEELARGEIDINDIPEYIIYDKEFEFIRLLLRHYPQLLDELYKFDKYLITYDDLNLINICYWPDELLTVDEYIKNFDDDICMLCIPDDIKYHPKFVANFPGIDGNLDVNLLTEEYFEEIIDEGGYNLVDFWPQHLLSDSMIEYSIKKIPESVAYLNWHIMLKKGKYFYDLAIASSLLLSITDKKIPSKSNIISDKDIEFIF